MADSEQNTLGLDWGRSTDGYYLVAVSGRLDLAESTFLEKELVAQIKKEPKDILLNLDGIHFMSSSGIRALIAVLRTCKSEVCKLILCQIPSSVKKIMEVVEVSHLFEIYDREEDALPRLGS